VRHHLLAAVSSEPTIKLYNYTVAGAGGSARLEHYAELRGHTGAIHDIKFHNVHGSFDTAAVESANGACMLSSCGEDATVKFWDVRQQNPVLNLTRQSRELSASFSTAR
jgi:WD40 repeat protein